MPAIAQPFRIFGFTLRGDRQYFYVVLAYLVLCYVLTDEPDAHARRARAGGRAGSLSLGRDHGHQPHQISHAVVRRLRPSSPASAARSTRTIRAWCRARVSPSTGRSCSSPSSSSAALGSTMGTLMGAAFMVLLPEAMEWVSAAAARRPDRSGAGAAQQHRLPARDRDRPGDRPVPDLRAGRPRASLAADQSLLEALPVLILRPRRVETIRRTKHQTKEGIRR